ncbi:MAG TPA: phosphotransferase [Streptosporangiaceae bacterium]|nr:phosphotransferase [Streptosporangiaceae bacterium]
MLDLTGAAFAARVCAAFGLPDDAARLRPLPASSTRLWELRAGGDLFAVKEFAYQHQAPGRAAGLAAAAAFEYSVWRVGTVVMPEPLPATDGGLITSLEGSRGSVVAVRVHRWLEGRAVSAPADERTAAAAGDVLAAIQSSGAAHSSMEGGSLTWWSEDLEEVLRRMVRAGLLPAARARSAAASLDVARSVLAAGERLPGPWIYTHNDHKPENSLLAAGRVAVLDWDECGHCHPRLEAVESALRWAGVGDGEPDPAAFRAFLRGHQRASGGLDDLGPADFAKFVAALAGWLGFVGSRALGEFDDTDAERATAADMAVSTLGALDRTLDSLERWAKFAA